MVNTELQPRTADLVILMTMKILKKRVSIKNDWKEEKKIEF